MSKGPNTRKSNDRRSKGRKDGDPAGGIAADIDRQRAVQLRRDGHSFEEIAAALRVAKSTAHKYVNDGWDRINETTDEERRLLRAEWEARLMAMLKRAMPLATHNNLVMLVTEFTADGAVEVKKDAAELQLKAMDRVLKIAKAHAELYGLNAPTKIELPGDKNRLEPLSELARRVAEFKAAEGQ